MPRRFQYVFGSLKQSIPRPRLSVNRLSFGDGFFPPHVGHQDEPMEGKRLAFQLYRR